MKNFKIIIASLILFQSCGLCYALDTGNEMLYKYGNYIKPVDFSFPDHNVCFIEYSYADDWDLVEKCKAGDKSSCNTIHLALESCKAGELNDDCATNFLANSIIKNDREIVKNFLSTHPYIANKAAVHVLSNSDVTNLGESCLLETPLMTAITKDRIDILQDLIANKNVDLNKQDYSGVTALMCVAMQGKVEAVRLLLANTRIDPNIQDRSGSTALMFAAAYNKDEVVKMLLADARVDPNKVDEDWNTALTWAVEKNAVLAVKELLLDKRVDVNVVTGGFTPLLLAVSKNYTEIIQVLLENNKVNPNINCSAFGRTALMGAAITGDIKTVEAFLAKANREINPVDINMQDKMGLTASQLAIMNHHPEIAKIIQEHPKATDVNHNLEEIRLQIADYIFNQDKNTCLVE